MTYRITHLAAFGALLLLPTAVSAATAVATRPMSIHAAPNEKAHVIGLIGVSQVVEAKNCRKGWCAASGGYVQSAYLRFMHVSKDYDYNVPLPLPPYGYTPGFWGYGGKRYYDAFGNYAKYGQQGYAGPPRQFETGPVETRPRWVRGRR